MLSIFTKKVLRLLDVWDLAARWTFTGSLYKQGEMPPVFLAEFSLGLQDLSHFTLRILCAWNFLPRTWRNAVHFALGFLDHPTLATCAGRGECCPFFSLSFSTYCMSCANRANTTFFFCFCQLNFWYFVVKQGKCWPFFSLNFCEALPSYQVVILRRGNAVHFALKSSSHSRKREMLSFFALHC